MVAGVYRFISPPIPPQSLISPASSSTPSLRSNPSVLLSALYFIFQTNSTNFTSDLRKGYIPSTELVVLASSYRCRATFCSFEFLCTDILFSVLGYLRSAGPNAQFRVSELYGETAMTSCSQGCNGPQFCHAPLPTFNHFSRSRYVIPPWYLWRRSILLSRLSSPPYKQIERGGGKNSYQLARTWIRGRAGEYLGRLG